MTTQQDIDAIKARISQAESERDAWRAAGTEEKYLEAYVIVEALQMQLDAHARQTSAGQPARTTPWAEFVDTASSGGPERSPT